MAFTALYRSGYTIQRAASAADYIDVYPGDVRDQLNSADISAWTPWAATGKLTKRFNVAWSPGNNGGLIPPGYNSASSTNGWWYVYVLLNPTTGAVDLCSMPDLGSIAPASVMASTYGFTKYRLIGPFQAVNTTVQYQDMRHNIPNGIHVSYPKCIDTPNGLDPHRDNYVINTSTASLLLDVNVPVMGPVTALSVQFNANVAIFHPTSPTGITISNGNAFWEAASLTKGPLLDMYADANKWAYANLNLSANESAQILVRALTPGTVISICTKSYEWPSGWLI